MGKHDNTDVAAWACRQAALLRARQWSGLDIEQLAQEIEDVARSEHRELAGRFQVLLCHLLKWQCQPDRRGHSWCRTIRDQRAAIARKLARMPSLGPVLRDEAWFADVWADAVRLAAEQTRLEQFYENSPWSIHQILDPDFLPEFPSAWS